MEFLSAITSIRQKTFKRTSIVSAFKKCGLVPYNLQIILDYLLSTLPRTPSPEPSGSDEPWSSHEVPDTIRRLKRESDWLRTLELTPTKKFRVADFIEGSSTQAYSLTQVQKELNNTKAAQEARARRNQGRRTRLQKGGLLYVGDARSMVKAKVAATETQERQQAERLPASIDEKRAKDKAKRLKRLFIAIRKQKVRFQTRRTAGPTIVRATEPTIAFRKVPKVTKIKLCTLDQESNQWSRNPSADRVVHLLPGYVLYDSDRWVSDGEGSIF
ncbi:hypothetical protein EDC01DRAFT_634597 [Geopyxis carbonaria]|nr:hypothetical protein EDC01DRAFT_634597 [Geopyxis carbonaria]